MASGVIFPEDCIFCEEMVWEDEGTMWRDHIVHERCVQNARSSAFMTTELRMENDRLRKRIDELEEEKSTGQLSLDL
ncbi:hypothetical protein [Domibacillus enclensis]|uniref:Uncharacterized protein n=1 Tax=Domibacillus enclensis TaxID=1017273 RepID=A0A1N6WH00_9BACI|nr:hypothetical protein [Domibacillus enclensis]OXS77930.1 hypothetical protein B1B05_10010 [Domibacillus enclensis]SIQ89315.1 hypothetical protein SAMN05443094_104162 [Domibacillus enclensis]